MPRSNDTNIGRCVGADIEHPRIGGHAEAGHRVFAQHTRLVGRVGVVEQHHGVLIAAIVAAHTDVGDRLIVLARQHNRAGQRTIGFADTAFEEQRPEDLAQLVRLAREGRGGGVRLFTRRIDGQGDCHRHVPVRRGEGHRLVRGVEARIGARGQGLAVGRDVDRDRIGGRRRQHHIVSVVGAVGVDLRRAVRFGDLDAGRVGIHDIDGDGDSIGDIGEDGAGARHVMRDLGEQPAFEHAIVGRCHRNDLRHVPVRVGELQRCVGTPRSGRHGRASQ